MSRLASMMGPLGAAALLEHAGETITYTPSEGDAASISALVNRETLQVRGPDGSARLEYVVSIAVRRADVATVTTGGDTVALKLRISDSSTTTLTVTSIISQDGAMWELGLN